MNSSFVPASAPGRSWAGSAGARQTLAGSGSAAHLAGERAVSGTGRALRSWDRLSPALWSRERGRYPESPWAAGHLGTRAASGRKWGGLSEPGPGGPGLPGIPKGGLAEEKGRPRAPAAPGRLSFLCGVGFRGQILTGWEADAPLGGRRAAGRSTPRQSRSRGIPFSIPCPNHGPRPSHVRSVLPAPCVEAQGTTWTGQPRLAGQPVEWTECP